MKNNVLIFVLLVAAALLSSCEKAVFDDVETESSTENEVANLTLRVTNIKQIGYNSTRAVVDITGYSSRLNFVLYKDGERVQQIDQKQDDEGYGEVSLSLMPGTYKVLVLAHSSKGNPTLADAESIRFGKDISYSDTFYYYGDIEVGTEAKTHDLLLVRVSSLLRFIINDAIPESVAKIRFFYTGGSCVLNAATGYGNSSDTPQEKLYNIEGLSAPLTLSLYTFLLADEGKLDVKVQAEDKNNNVVLERSFSNISVKRNMITEYSGAFFEHDNGFSFTADTEWGGVIQETY